MENNVTAQLEKKISMQKFKNEDLFEIRIHIKMPYYSDKEYESFYKETDWNGNYYRFVKRKIKGNILHLFFLPHTQKNKLIKIKNELAGSVNDTDQNNQQEDSGTTVIKLMQTKYTQPGYSRFALQSFQLSIEYDLKNTPFYTQFCPQSPLKPPDTI